MKIKNILVVYANITTEEQKLSANKVKDTLRKYKIKYKLAKRDELSNADFKNRDLVIAVGGDGTFLRTAQFVKSHLLFGVNSDVKNKEGFFMGSNKDDFEVKLKKIMNNEFKIKKLLRLGAFVDTKKLNTLALNEFFIGPRKSYHAAKYLLSVNGKKERQKSSGILITTPTGSYAWAKSCRNKTLPLDSKNYQFVVREPYEGRLFRNYKLKYGVLNKNQKISIFSEMLDGIIIADSVGKEYNFKNGSKAIINLSKHSLNVVWFR